MRLIPLSRKLKGQGAVHMLAAADILHNHNRVPLWWNNVYSFVMIKIDSEQESAQKPPCERKYELITAAYLSKKDVKSISVLWHKALRNLHFCETMFAKVQSG